MILTNKRKYILNPLKVYELVMRLRRENKRCGVKTIKKYLDRHGTVCSVGAIAGWIYKNKKPFVLRILNQIPESAKRLTKEKAYILGTLCGDGWISTGYRIGLNVIDKEFAEYFKYCLKTVYRIRCSIRKRGSRPTNFCLNPKTQYIISMVSKLAVQDLQKYHSSFKTKEWRVPKQIINSSKDMHAFFIKAFADSEGSVKNRKRNKDVILCSGNYSGLNDIKEILIKSFNIKSHLSQRKTKVCILAISDYKSLLTFQKEIGFIIQRKEKALKDVLTQYKRKGIRKYSEEFKKLAIDFLNQGLTHKEIGKLMSTNPANIYDWEKICKSPK